MKIKKRQIYIENLYACLHTLAGKCDSVNEQQASFEIIVKSCSKKKVRNEERYEYYLQLNPNRAVTSETMIKSYSEFREVLSQTLENIEAENFRVTRADLSFNSDNSADYELFKKLNRLLICCIANSQSIRNCYQTKDLWTNASLSVAIKEDTIEVENYNKELESQGSTETKNRLEFRSKRIRKPLPEEFQKTWGTRLDKAIERFEAVQERYNAELLQIWQNDLQKDKKDREFISVNAFLMNFKDCIFTKRQFVKLLTELGVQNPERKAKRFKEKHRIEFYSLTDLRQIVTAIKKVTRKFFEQ